MPEADSKYWRKEICLPALRRGRKAIAFALCAVLAAASIPGGAAAQSRNPLRALFGLDEPSAPAPQPQQQAPAAGQPAQPARPQPAAPPPVAAPLPPPRPAFAVTPSPAAPEPAKPQIRDQQTAPVTQTPFGTVYRPLGSSEFVPFTQPEPMPLRPKPLEAESAGESGASAPAAVPSPPQPEAPSEPLPPELFEPSAAPEIPPPPADETPQPVTVPLPPPRPAQQQQQDAAVPPPASQTDPAPVPAPAALPPASTLTDRQVVDRANRYFNNTETLQAIFTQLAGGSQRTTGTLYLERPGRIRFAYNPPATMEIVSDGKNVAIRDSKLNTSDVYSINQTPLKFLLRDPINLGTDLKVIGIDRDPTSVQITLEDASTIGGKAQITLFFDSKVENLTRWQIIDAQGFLTTVILSQVKRSTRRNG